MMFRLLLLLLSTELLFASECPANCSCHGPGSIFCINRRASTVPRVPATTLNLYIFQNGVDALSQDDFRGLDDLELLDLSQNELTEIPDGVFGMLSKLKNLDLSSNLITHIQKDSFSGLAQLERLYLHGNRIQSIHLEAFEGLETLLELKLQENHLSSLPSLRFPGLLLLDLSYNSIPTLGPSDFQTPHLEALKVVSLGLTSLDEELIASMGNLHELDLSMNQLTKVPPALKQDSLTGLIKLSLAGNPLGELRAEDFQTLTGLQELDLSGLNLEGFPPGFLQVFPRLSQLTAAENPFKCLCPLAWLPAWLKEKEVNLRRPEETRCHFPFVNAGMKLSALEPKDFGCPLTTTVPIGSPIGSTPSPLVSTTPPEMTYTNAIPPPPPPSSEEMIPSKTPYPLPPEPTLSPSSTSGEMEPHICPANICLNGGTCHFDPMGQLGCLCPSGTSGLYCENVDVVPELPKHSVTEAAIAAPSLPAENADAIGSRQVTSTSILLDLHRFIETRPRIRGIRLIYRNLSGPDRRPIILSIPASYPEYTLRGLKPNCTYLVCASPLDEQLSLRANGSVETESCTEARTEGILMALTETTAPTPSPMTFTLVLAVAALALVLVLSFLAGTIICVRRRREAKAGTELEMAPADSDPAELDGIKVGLENGGNGALPHKQAEIDRCHTPPSLQNGGLDYEVPLMQGHLPSNNNLASLTPSYF